MRRMKRNSEGFTLIATLMVLFLLSGIAIAMLMMVNSEVKVGTQDVQNNQTFHAAEGAIEKMTSDLATAYQGTLSPTVSDITGLSALVPTSTYQQASSWPGVTFPVYSLTPVTNAAGNIAVTPGVVPSGPYAGLNAQLMNVQLQATAQGPLGDEVNMSRTVEVAMIPVFQFGVFSNMDLAYFSSPPINFGGRVHTNGDLYLGCGTGNTCTFQSQVTAYGNVIRAVLPNGLAAGANNDSGTVKVPKASGGCSGAQPACVSLPTAGNLWGSVTGAGGNPAASPYNNGPPSWQTISLTNTAGWMIDGNYGLPLGTGASNLNLPFVNGAVAAVNPGLNIGPQAFEIVRRPPAGESSTSPLGASRLYNEAAIRVLLSDTPEELPGGAADLDNVRLANVVNQSGLDSHLGVVTLQPNLPALPGGHSYTTYFATASTEIPNPGTTAGVGVYYPDWLYAPLATLGEFANEFDAADGNVPFLFAGANGVTTSPPTVSPNALCNTATGVCPPYPYYTLIPQLNTPAAGDTQWNLLDGYLRVEFLPNTGAGCPGPGSSPDGYCAITREWLGLGFARYLTPPTAPGVPYVAGSNSVNPYGILLLQQPAKRNTSGWPAPPALDMNGTAPTCVKVGAVYNCTGGKPPEVIYDQNLFSENAAWVNPWHGDSFYTATTVNKTPSLTAFNWYPINFYDAREGEPSDTIQGNNSCTPLGVMNAVELDVGNLALWLKGTIPGSGTLVNYTNQNGYVLYFSDRRGMLTNPNGTQVSAAGNISGDAGFEDVINSASVTRAPDGVLDPIPAGKLISPEDDNLNGLIDKFGSQNLGLGLGYVPTPAPGLYTAANAVNKKINAGANPNPYLTTGRMSSCTVAQRAWISGARHVLKLVDGGMSAAGVSYLPSMPVAFPNNGGFTVGSENPVYIFGDYNTNAADTTWTTGVDQNHAAAGIIADTVSLLSNNWVDWNSLLLQPTQPAGNRRAATTHYRTAVASGRVQDFPYPAFAAASAYYTGTDGGVHNFLRFLEDWQSAPQQSLFYEGSMVNLFYSTYNTGIFKCCNYSVYQPPVRNYNFDNDFTTVQGLPPGTPSFRDIDNLSYRQNFAACTVQANGTCTN